MTQPRLGDDSAFWTKTVIAEYSEGDDSAVHKKSPVQIKHDNASLYLCNTQEIVSSTPTTI